MGQLMHRTSLFVVLSLLALGGGLAIAVRYAEPSTFWTNFGFMLAGVGFGVVVAVWVVQGILSQRHDSEIRETKRKLLRSIGHDCVGAIGRTFWGFTFEGQELSKAWYYGIETGQTSPEGFKDAVYHQQRPALTNNGMDFDISLLMVTRALGRAYARFDLFDSEELPINALESAAALLRDGKAKGSLDSFEGAMLISPLGEAVETCGKLLWQLGGFVTRADPAQERVS